MIRALAFVFVVFLMLCFVFNGFCPDDKRL